MLDYEDLTRTDDAARTIGATTGRCAISIMTIDHLHYWLVTLDRADYAEGISESAEGAKRTAEEAARDAHARSNRDTTTEDER